MLGLMFIHVGNVCGPSMSVQVEKYALMSCWSFVNFRGFPLLLTTNNGTAKTTAHSLGVVIKLSYTYSFLHK